MSVILLKPYSKGTEGSEGPVFLLEFLMKNMKFIATRDIKIHSSLCQEAIGPAKENLFMMLPKTKAYMQFSKI